MDLSKIQRRHMEDGGRSGRGGYAITNIEIDYDNGADDGMNMNIKMTMK